MTIQNKINNINEYYKVNKLCSRDFHVISYYNDIIKIGACWDITNPYDECLILKEIDMIDCPTEWVSDVNKDFMFLVHQNEEKFIEINKRYNNKYEEGYHLLKIINDDNYAYYFSIKDIIFIEKKLSIQQILELT